jgi:23S rRNA pseudouridine1911/1915/1917 synthase
MKPPRIVHEDDYLLVIDKPAGMVVDRATTVKTETVQDWIARNFQFPIANDQSLRNGVVHRLDRETSGLLLVAKTPEAFANLQRQFKERKVEKRYLALVHGKVEPEKGLIAVPLSRVPKDKKKVGVFLGGRKAQTGYKVRRRYDLKILGKFSLLELAPKTGRTHQIRVHLKFINHPIVGDATYAGRKTARRDRTWCPRQFLHATQITFTHPESEEKVEFNSPLPADLRAALTHLQI